MMPVLTSFRVRHYETQVFNSDPAVTGVLVVVARDDHGRRERVTAFVDTFLELGSPARIASGKVRAEAMVTALPMTAVRVRQARRSRCVIEGEVA